MTRNLEIPNILTFFNSQMLIIVSLLGENLTFLRKNKKLKQDEMLTAIGINRSTWSNYENGLTEPNLDTIVRISEFFSITIDDLLKIDVGSDVHLTTLDGRSKKQAKSTPKSTPNSTPNDGKTQSNQLEDQGKNDSKLDTWVVLGQLQKMDEKIDWIRVLLQERPSKKK